MSKTLEKALNLLDYFTEEKPYWRLDEISNHSGIPKATAFRLLRTFTELGYLQRITFQQDGLVVDGESYGLGLKFLEMGERVAERFEIRRVALPYMKKLQETFNEAVQLVIRDQYEGVYIEKVESTRPVRLYTKVGRHAPLYAGACTRMLLTFLPEEMIEKVLEKPLTNYASQTPKTKEEVLKLIAQTKLEGFSYSDSELEEGTVSIAVPIFDRSGSVPYSISIAGFSTSFPREKIQPILGPLWEAAAGISKEIGYNYPYPYGEKIKIEQ
ncbi:MULTISPECIES: IclR family transcriptional regulator [unclassified Bacillus (in: firmicutes)]|uniref:IclR family transcriptional regulator n=1 Tax=unclassified Bacillus (in: firmicutes) TaxID=185979 RepID=UPI00300083CD